jgi:hypothetical protein
VGQHHEDITTGLWAEGGAIGSDTHAVGEALVGGGGVARGLIRCPPCA